MSGLARTALRVAAAAIISISLLAQSETSSHKNLTSPTAAQRTRTDAVLRFGPYRLPDPQRRATWRGIKGAATLSGEVEMVKAYCGNLVQVSRANYRFELLDQSALRGRTTRVSVDWSAVGSGWSEQEVELKANGARRRLITRSGRPAWSGRLQLDIPALSVRSSEKLDVVISIAARCLGKGAPSIMRIDTLEIGMLS